VQTEVGGLLAGVVHAESYHSELGNELGKEFSYLDYIAIINMSGRKVGFRTIHDEVDVSEIAAHYGGGGHAKASGCTLTPEAYEVFVAKPFTLAPIRQDASNNHFNVKHSPQGTLYRQNDDRFFIYLKQDNEWRIERNGKVLDESFQSFTEAEKYLKRTHTAALVRDKEFVEYLMNHYRETKSK
ncbi:MAG TPA: hypothetical protein VEY51_01880, partial [Chondromyces sp.]|nr:hypothetical protein [Chondromyces sp.]